MTRGAISYLGCAEPSWFKAVQERQLAGLLNLCALLTEFIYLSDVHLGDNLNFFSSYRANERGGLYNRVKSLAEMGIVRFLLRDASFRPESDPKNYVCENFTDVYKSWVRQNHIESWIFKEISDDRERYFNELDSWALAYTDRYKYQEIKIDFMEKVRRACETTPNSWFGSLLHKFSPILRSDYFELIKRDWFSLSDIYDFFQSRGFVSSHDMLLYHGLINEMAYNNDIGALFVGADKDNRPIERVFWERDEIENSVKSISTLNVEEIMGRILDHAHEVLDAGSLSVLALLAPEEVMKLREAGRSYFDLLKLAQDPLYISSSEDFPNQFVSTVVGYWRTIIDFIRNAHQGAALKPTKFAIFVGELPTPFEKIAESAFTFALNIGSQLPGQLLPKGKILDKPLENLFKKMSLRFLFLSDTRELKKMKSVIPNRAWLTKSNPDLFHKGH